MGYTNIVTFITASGAEDISVMKKTELADLILDKLASLKTI